MHSCRSNPSMALQDRLLQGLEEEEAEEEEEEEEARKKKKKEKRKNKKEKQKKKKKKQGRGRRRKRKRRRALFTRGSFKHSASWRGAGHAQLAVDVVICQMLIQTIPLHSVLWREHAQLAGGVGLCGELSHSQSHSQCHAHSHSHLHTLACSHSHSHSHPHTCVERGMHRWRVGLACSESFGTARTPAQQV